MDSSLPNDPTTDPHDVPPASDAGPPLNVFQRVIAVFVRPGNAWGGLEQRAQWWFPFLLSLVFIGCFSLVLHERAMLPMMQDQFERQVSEGQMTPEAAAGMERMMSGPMGLVMSIVPPLFVTAVLSFVIALILWFGVAFVLGRKFKYRLALEVACWSSLVNIPGQILVGALAWSKQTMRDLHIGFGILLPETETPTKIMQGLGVVLDAFGPFALWSLAVGILGAAALSGAPRKSVAWVLGGLYLVLVLVMAAMTAFFGPAA